MRYHHPYFYGGPGMNDYTNSKIKLPLPARLSRRRMLASMAGFAGAALVAGCDLPGQSSSQGTATPARPTTAPTQVASPDVTGEAVVPPGSTLLVYRGQAAPLHDVAWSPDGTHIASACGSLTISPPKEDKSVHVWDASTGKTSLVYKNPFSGVTTIGWSPDSKYIASLQRTTTTVWDAQSGRERTAFTPDTNDSWVTSLAWSPDGRRIAIAGYLDVQIWDAAIGKKLLTYPATLPPNQSQQSVAVAWSPDGRRIASAAAKTGHSIQVWDASNAQPLYYFPGGYPTAIAWSPDGNYLAVQDIQALVTVWEATPNGNMVFTHRATPPIDLQVVADFARPHAIAWSSDSAHLAFAGYDRPVQVWNVLKNLQVLTYEEHTGIVWAVTWSPDGMRVASASLDEMVRVWQAI
jgi:WD40 repeat protein